MIKLSRRSSRKFGSYIDPEKVELLKKSKIEIEDRVRKVLNECQEKEDGNPEDSQRVTELVELIEDFNRQYQSLYSVYDNLRVLPRNSSRFRKDKEGLSHSSSGSDDDQYYSTDEVDIRHENEVAELKQEMTSINEEKKSLNMEYNLAMNKMQEAGEKERELNTLLNKEKDVSSEAADQITGLKLELETLHSKKIELESQLRDDILKLQTRVLELESEKRQDGDSLENLKSNENDSSSQAAEIMSQYRNLQQEVISLRGQNDELEQRMEIIRNEASAQVNESTERVYAMEEELEALRVQNHELISLRVLKDEFEQRMESIKCEASAQVNVIQQEMEALRVQSHESELRLESKSKEISENLTQIETLKDELAKTAVERTLKYKEDLELEADPLLNRRNEPEQQISAKEREISALQKNSESAQKQESSQSQITQNTTSEPAQKQEASQSRSTQNTKPVSAQKQKSSQSLIMQNINKFNKIIADQPRGNLRVSDDSVKPEPKTKLEPARSLNSQNITRIAKYMKTPDNSPRNMTRLTPQATERKMEELAADFRKHIEDKIRLMTRRIRVLEQLHAENRECHRRAREKLEEENKMLHAKVTTYEAALARLKDLYEAAKLAKKGLALMVNRVDVGNTQLDRISRIFNELQSAKNWIQGKTRDLKQMQHDFQVKEEEALPLRENMSKLEAKVSQLEQKVEEKDEELLCIGEEKREAIRQLSASIDHHFTQNQDLKEMVLKLRSRIIQKPH